MTVFTLLSVLPPFAKKSATTNLSTEAPLALAI
jgi:hypothetical protein